MKKKLVASFVIGLFILSITGVANATLFVNVPFETAGNEPQSSPGPYSLGLNFDVVSPIQVTSLGAFDSLSDGIFLSEIQVAIFNRETETLVTPILTFTSEDHGTAVGISGFTFKSLSVPVIFDEGFQGVVVANGYNGVSTAYEPFGNIAHSGAPVTTFDDGGGLLTNLGWYSYNRPTTSLTYDPINFIETQGDAQGDVRAEIAQLIHSYSPYHSFKSDSSIPDETARVMQEFVTPR